MVTKETESKANELFYKDMIDTLAEKLLLSEMNDIAYNVMEEHYIVMKGKFIDGINHIRTKN